MTLAAASVVVLVVVTVALGFLGAMAVIAFTATLVADPGFLHEGHRLAKGAVGVAVAASV